MTQKPVEKARVRLYTKQGCHLCEEAKREILKAAIPDEYTLEEVDIESDPVIFERYRYDIPVVVINGTHAFRHRLTADEFRRALRKYSTGP